MASRLVRARLDDASASALRLLVNLGMTESEAVRSALVEAAAARTTEDALHAQVAMLMADPAEVERSRRILAEMESIRLPWPD